MAYLTAAEATARELTATDAEIAQASSVIDAFLKRPEGLVYVAEADGAPCYMAGLPPVASYALSAPIAPGLNVTAALTGWVTQALLGEVLIADQGNDQVEALTVVGVTDQVVTLARVKRAHSGSLVQGLTISEQKSLPANRPVTRVSRPQLARVISGVGRYSYGRRSDQAMGNPDWTLLPTLQAFAGVPVWQPFDPNDAVVSPNGEMWIPPGLAMAYFNDVRLSYVAGYPTSAIPEPIKAATANVLATLQQFPELSGNMKAVAAGGTKLERFSDQALDADTRNMLAPFMARVWS